MQSSQVTSAPQNIFQALAYLQKGWSILPIHFPNGERCSCGDPQCKSPAKHPMTRNGVKDAICDPSIVCNAWTKSPHANIGIATGNASGIMVVDIDPRHGGDRSWEEFKRKNMLPQTLTVRTGGGGLHIYYRTNGITVPNKVNVLSGVDIRGDGGYVLAPPSMHASGKQYTWATEGHKIAELPEAIKDLFSQKKPTTRIGATISPGARNATLTSLAGTMRRQGFDEAGINKALSVLNANLCQEPLDDKEVATIAKSIAKFEVPHQASAKIDWPKVSALPDLSAVAPSMTNDFLPTNLRPWVADITERMQVPTSFVAIPAIVSLCSVVGRQVGIFPKQRDDWFVVPNIWGTVIARPGFFKTPAIAEALKPLDYLIKKAQIKFEAESVVSKCSADIVKATIEGIKENVKKAVRKGNQHEVEHLKEELEKAMAELQSLSVSEERYKTNEMNSQDG